ncbi:MAG TPA: hypothetical protein VNE62_09320, partial [Actinomycetota bacterium]|nr:hypothetical protein [Actinomycetota bacterium]
MTGFVQTARIFRYSAAVALEDFRTMYTLRSWVFEWLTRIVSQVIFFSLMGKLVESQERVEFLLVGNAVMLASMTVMFVVQTTSWERMTGTLPLLIAAPATPLVVFMGRSVEWIPDALATAVAGLVIVAPMFGVSVPLSKLAAILPL